MANFVNLTPHPIHIYKNDQTYITIPPSGSIARMEQKEQSDLDPVDGISIKTAPSFTNVSGLPKNKPSPKIIVSMPVGSYLQNNPKEYSGDVYGPDTGDGVIRSETGMIIGTKNLVKYK